jgi:hypothetical protein
MGLSLVDRMEQAVKNNARKGTELKAGLAKAKAQAKKRMTAQKKAVNKSKK